MGYGWRPIINMPQLKVAFFTEAGSTRGMGHLMRCYALYDYFKKQSHIVDFFLDSDINYDYKLQKIHYFTWENFFLDEKYDIIFIDSYLAPRIIYEIMADNAKIPIFIDDYARIDYPRGVILNFSPNAEDFFPNKNPIHTYLLGLKFLPLRPELNIVQPKKREQIFISLGGSDIKNYSYEIVKALQHMNIPLIVTINDYDIANQIALYENTHILFKPSDEEFVMSMKESTIAITTASMTVYELAFMQIPSIIIAVSHNQLIGAEHFIRHSLAYKLLDMESEAWDRVLECYLQEFLITPFRPKNNYVDGRGADRIYKSIKEVYHL